MAAPKLDPERVRMKNQTLKMAIWSRQLSVLFKAGLPLARSLEVLCEQTEDPRFRQVQMEINSRVNGGCRLSVALARYPRMFSRVFVGLIRAGEESGGLVSALEKLAAMLERESALQQRLSSALTYPAFILTVTIVLTLFVFYSILPAFIDIFRDQHLVLPLITRILIAITNAIRSPGTWCLVLGLSVEGYILLKKMTATEQGSLSIYRLAMLVPILGRSLHMASLSRFCLVMSTLLGSGVTLLSCLKLAGAASGSPLLRSDNKRLIQFITEGEKMSAYVMEHPEVYPKLMAHMLVAGEESSGVDTSFSRLSTWFNEEMDYSLDLLTATIEPVLMAFVSVIVASIVIGIFLPLYGLVADLGV